MISIAIVVPELLPVPPVQGGAVEHWVQEVCARLDKQKYSITIFSRPSGVLYHNKIKYSGIPWTKIEKFFFGIKERSSKNNLLRHVAKVQNVYSYGRRVARELSGFDVIYIHNEPNILQFIKKQPRQKIVLHMHNDHLSLRLLRLIYRNSLSKVDKIICISDYIRRCAVQCFPEFVHRFCVIFNATNPQVFKSYGDQAMNELNSTLKIDSNKQYLLYAGRLSSIKGVHVLIQAFRKLNCRLPDTRLIITGSSFFDNAARTPYEQYLVKLAEPVNSAIMFTGFLPHDKLKYLYSIADIVVFPSVWEEPSGLVMLEAMASGTCFVGSKVGGVPEVVNDQINGVLVPPDNVSKLAEALYKVLRSPDVKHQMEVKAREKIIAGYTWERLVKELETLLGELQ